MLYNYIYNKKGYCLLLLTTEGSDNFFNYYNFRTCEGRIEIAVRCKFDGCLKEKCSALHFSQESFIYLQCNSFSFCL